MTYLIRGLLLSLLLFSALEGWLAVAGIIFIGYLFFYTGYELVVVAFLLDGYYGAFISGVPYLTLGAFSAWSGVLLLRQRLLLYTQKDEIIP